MRWILPADIDHEGCERLATAARIPRWLAGLLMRRGFGEPEAALGFLSPRLRDLGDPFALQGMDVAIDRLLAAIDGHERVVVYGDYDVDGVASIALLVRVLRAYGCNAASFLPHRVDEGYGLSAEGVARCMELYSPQLLLAVDCGTTSLTEIEFLREQGVDTLVFDHHEPKERLPEAVAIVNPKLGDEFHYLCSAGIVFKAAHALLKRRRQPGLDLKTMLDLVAIATIADIVPLVKENRILVRAGLERMAHTSWPGIRALCEVAEIKRPFDSSHIGFAIGPRLNASGRLASAEASLELLLADDEERAKQLAKMLDEQNSERRIVENEVMREAEAQALSVCDPANTAGIVVGAQGWHPGVVGIVASRIQRRFYRPAVVIAFDTMGNGKGSGRCIAGISLFAVLERCAGMLEKFGGHERAAGLSLRQEMLGEFRAAFDRVIRDTLQPSEMEPILALDEKIELGDVSLDFIEMLDALQPYGAENPRPIFFANHVRRSGEIRVMKERHYGLQLRQGDSVCRAVWWNAADKPLPPDPWDVAFTVERNEWNGSVRAQLHIQDLRSAR